jgi:ribosomal protein S20
MPITRSAKKAVKTSATKKTFNDRRRRTMREAVKSVRSAMKDNSAEAQAKLSDAYKAIDKAPTAWLALGIERRSFIGATCCDEQRAAPACRQAGPAALCNIRVLGVFYLVTVGHSCRGGDVIQSKI